MGDIGGSAEVGIGGGGEALRGIFKQRDLVRLS